MENKLIALLTIMFACSIVIDYFEDKKYQKQIEQATIHTVINMTHLVILFDTLIKFKSVTVPHHLVNSFCDYCIKRGKIVMGGIMHEEYQYFYID